MKHLKEPEGIDFFVDSTPLKGVEQKLIHDVIALYKATKRKTRIKPMS